MTQNEQILKTLLKGNTITERQARARGIMNLRARIHELRTQKGLNITTFTSKQGVTKYGLKKLYHTA
jgi:hypothetical protein